MRWVPSFFLVGVLGLGLSIHTQKVCWADGYEVASRHSLMLNAASHPVLGNGSMGFLFTEPGDSKSFLSGILRGEQWVTSPANEPIPAVRAELLHAEVDITPGSPDTPSLPPFLTGSIYRLDENAILNRFAASDRSLSATVTISPTRNLLILSGKSTFPVDVRIKISIPEPPLADPAPLAATEVRQASVAVLSLVQSLPRQESFGAGITLSEGTFEKQADGRTWVGTIRTAAEWRAQVIITSQDDNRPLMASTAAEAGILAGSPEDFFHQERKGWWRKYWNQSMVDFQGSTHPIATKLERLWVFLLHGMATHAGGTFPPGDAGFTSDFHGGRPWHSVLWPEFRGWLHTNHAGDIRCLCYASMLPERDTVPSSTPQNLIPSECGSDGIGSQDLDELAERLMEIGLVRSGQPWNEKGWLFSTLPWMHNHPLYVQARPEDSATIYPYLFRNASMAEQVLSVTGESSDPSLRPYLLSSIGSAYSIAERNQIDGPTRRRWKDILDKHGVAIDSATGTAVGGFPDVSGLFAPYPTLSQVEPALEAISITPSGLLPDGNGRPSVLKTGWWLGILADLLVREAGGVIQVLPDFQSEGEWTIHFQNIGTAQGIMILSATLRKGVLDSFILQSVTGGKVRLSLPRTWTSARVALLDDPQTVIEVHAIDGSGFSFSAEKGQTFLIGPVW